MTIETKEDELLHVPNLHTVKKHQYDILVDECKKACRNNHDTIVWLGQEYSIQFAHHMIEYLDPHFKEMK